jgi:hypothetical protein
LFTEQPRRFDSRSLRLSEILSNPHALVLRVTY